MIITLRSLLFDLYWGLWTVLLSLSLPILWLLGRSDLIRKLARLWVNGILFGLKYIVGLDYRERGRENLPAGPCVIIANHQSAWETLAFTTLFPDASFVAKKETGRVPIVGWYLKNYPMVMIDRSAGSGTMRQMIDESRATLADGRSVIIFPEGTRKPTTVTVEFRRGIEFMYTELGVPVLPVAINSGFFWRRNKKHPGTVTVSYLPPVAPGLTRQEFKEQTERALQAEKEKLLAEAAAAARD